MIIAAIEAVLPMEQAMADITFVKILSVRTVESFTFLLGTTLDTYEMRWDSNVLLTVLSSFGNYYQCEHI